MAIVPLLFSQLSSLLLIAIIGYAAVKKGIMKASECTPISTLLIYVIIPSSIIKALQLPLSEEKIHGFGLAVIFAIAVHLFWLVLISFLGKTTSLDGTARASLITPIQETSSFPWWPPFLVRNTSFMPACTMPSNNFLSGPTAWPS